MPPTIIEPFLGGIRVFFSAWQLCIMQVTPFYLAFFTGAYLILRKRNKKGAGLFVLAVAAGLWTGFSLAFSVLAVPSLPAGAVMLENIDTLKFFSGVFIIAAGLVMMILSLSNRPGREFFILGVFSLLAGASFAIGYSPCISPPLSKVLNFSSIPGNGMKGVLLLFMYGSGMSFSITVIGIVIMVFLGALLKRKYSAVPPIIAAAVFMIMGIFLVSGLMLRYKAILVNLV